MAQLITLEDIRGFAPGAKLRVAKGTLFTPSATDYAHEKRLVIEYEAAETSIGCPEDSPELRREVIESCRWLLEKNLTIGTWGNISVRLNDGNILITPSKRARAAPGDSQPPEGCKRDRAFPLPLRDGLLLH